MRARMRAKFSSLPNVIYQRAESIVLCLPWQPFTHSEAPKIHIRYLARARQHGISDINTNEHKYVCLLAAVGQRCSNTARDQVRRRASRPNDDAVLTSRVNFAPSTSATNLPRVFTRTHRHCYSSARVLRCLRTHEMPHCDIIDIDVFICYSGLRDIDVHFFFVYVARCTATIQGMRAHTEMS